MHCCYYQHTLMGWVVPGMHDHLKWGHWVKQTYILKKTKTITPLQLRIIVHLHNKSVKSSFLFKGGILHTKEEHSRRCTSWFEYRIRWWWTLPDKETPVNKKSWINQFLYRRFRFNNHLLYENGTSNNCYQKIDLYS